MSKLKARALEALVGAGGGGAVGGVAGGLSYKPEFPLEWIDENDDVHARRLSKDEKKERLQRMLRGALLGGALGSTAGLGASAVRRGRISQRERAGVAAVADDYLSDLRSMATSKEKLRDGLKRTPGGLGTSLGKGLQKELDAARSTLSEQKSAITGLLGEASSRRAAKPFGGVNVARRRGEAVGYGPDSHVKLVQDHFDALAKRRGFERFTPDNSQQIWADLIHSKTKTAAVAYRRELAMIGRRA